MSAQCPYCGTNITPKTGPYSYGTSCPHDQGIHDGMHIFSNGWTQAAVPET